ncbi:MAG: PQQ-binding-like beta-propeller repeat protein [Deltaproteobacteria bacterium]|nr:PQQ-binding-like beta-propeller repeat protein [Candidatus Zymogenaceae bacterium]
MKSFRTTALLLFSPLLFLTLSCAAPDKDVINGTVTSIAEGDGGEGTLIWIDKGSAGGIVLNQEGWVLEKGDTFATIMVDEVESDTCRAVVLEHTPFKAVTEGLSVRFDANGTILSPEASSPRKPCPDIPGPYVPTVGGNMARTGSYDEKGVPTPMGVLWKIRTDRWISPKGTSGSDQYLDDSYSPLVIRGLIFIRGGGFYAEAGMKDEEKYRVHELMDRDESSVILNGAIYTPGSSRLIAFDFISQSVKWSYDIEAMAPAVSKDRVFLASHEGASVALDAATGKEIWRIETADPESGEQTFTSPALDGDTVYFGGADFFLYAVDAETGVVRWKYDVGWYLTSRYVVVDNDTIYVANRDYLIALDKQTRAEKWRFKVTGYVGIAPAVACGSVFVFDQGNLCSVDAQTGLLKWRFSLKDIGFTKEEYTYDPPIVVDGIVYFGGLDESVYAVDADTGELLWSYKTEYKTSTPVIVDGVLYVTSGPYLYAIK